MINKKQKKLIQAFLQRTHLNQPYPVRIKQEVRVHTASILQQEQRKHTASQYAQPQFCQPDIVQGLKPAIIYTLTQYVLSQYASQALYQAGMIFFQRDPIPISCWYEFFLRDPIPISCWYDFFLKRSNTNINVLV